MKSREVILVGALAWVMVVGSGAWLGVGLLLGLPLIFGKEAPTWRTLLLSALMGLGVMWILSLPFILYSRL